jgi:hypothetical protein
MTLPTCRHDGPLFRCSDTQIQCSQCAAVFPRIRSIPAPAGSYRERVDMENQAG